MKSLKVLIVGSSLILLLFSCLLIDRVVLPEKWSENYIGIKQADVRDILGSPARLENSEKAGDVWSECFWFYCRNLVLHYNKSKQCMGYKVTRRFMISPDTRFLYYRKRLKEMREQSRNDVYETDGGN